MGRHTTKNSTANKVLLVVFITTSLLTIRAYALELDDGHAPIPEFYGLTPEQQNHNLEILTAPFVFVYNIFYATIAKILSIILFCLTPFLFFLSIMYQIFLYTPYTIVKRILTVFYPLYVFCTFAAIIGMLVGGIAGWFSEIIVSVLNAPSEATIISDQENKRARRRAVIAKLRQRNGLSDEQREKLFAQYGLPGRRRHDENDNYSRADYGDKYFSNQKPLNGGGVVIGN